LAEPPSDDLAECLVRQKAFAESIQLRRLASGGT
jgi:hypothetical protein